MRLIVTWLRWRHERPVHHWLAARAAYLYNNPDHH